MDSLVAFLNEMHEETKEAEATRGSTAEEQGTTQTTAEVDREEEGKTLKIDGEEEGKTLMIEEEEGRKTSKIKGAEKARAAEPLEGTTAVRETRKIAKSRREKMDMHHISLAAKGSDLAVQTQSGPAPPSPQQLEQFPMPDSPPQLLSLSASGPSPTRHRYGKYASGRSPS